MDSNVSEIREVADRNNPSQANGAAVLIAAMQSLLEKMEQEQVGAAGNNMFLL